MYLRQRWVLMLTGIVYLLPLSGCGGDEPADGGVDGTSSQSIEVHVTEKDGAVTADPDVVKASKGQEIVLIVDSDAEDAFHVHSEPEHEFEVKAREGQKFTFSMADGGQYEMESHELDLTILKLQIS